MAELGELLTFAFIQRGAGRTVAHRAHFAPKGLASHGPELTGHRSGDHRGHPSKSGFSTMARPTMLTANARVRMTGMPAA